MWSHTKILLNWHPLERAGHTVFIVSEFDSLSLGVGGIDLQPVRWSVHFNLAWMLSAYYLCRKIRIKTNLFSVIYIWWKAPGATVETIWFFPLVACHLNKVLAPAGGLEGHCLHQREEKNMTTALFLKCFSFKDMKNGWMCTHIHRGRGLV